MRRNAPLTKSFNLWLINPMGSLSLVNLALRIERRKVPWNAAENDEAGKNLRDQR